MQASDDLQTRDRLNEPVLPMQEDHEFWFLDGNVVFVCGQIAFRVHKGVVSRHSSVFEDLFTVPQPEQGETYSSCPIVRLPDSSVDIRHLLRVLYDGRTSYLKPREEKIEFREVAALVRLAQKYQVAELREDGLERLKSCFTDDFDQWERSLALGRTYSNVLKLEPTDAIAAVNLAYETDTKSMLPTALYMCCALKSSELLRGVPRGDGTTEQLSPQDLERCLDARSYLLNRNIVRDTEAFSSASESCTRPVECANILRRAREHRMMNSVGSKAYQALRSPDEFSRSLLKNFRLCEDCLDDVVENALKARRKIWKELPSLFGLNLPDWGRDDL